MNNNDFKINFIGIGSGKCGSTWFFENLVQHPEIHGGNPKETNYFSDLYTEHPYDWYVSQFRNRKPEDLTGEFSVTYMYHPHAAGRIEQHFPDTKIISIVRDPVKRTFSDFLHYKRKGDIPENHSFSDYIKNEKNLIFGKYACYLKPFLEKFPAEHIKIIILEDFSKDYKESFRDIYRFIGVNDIDFLPKGVEIKRNQARSYHLMFIENLMVRTYRAMAKAGHTKLTEKIKRSGIPELLRKINASKEPLPAINESSRDYLIEYFKEDKKALNELIGRPIETWSF